MNIRALTLQDYPQWQRLWQAYLAFYHTTLDDAVFETTFARLTSADHPQQNARVAEIGGTLQGLVHYIYHPHNWHQKDVIYLQDLYTDPTHRSEGIGRALIEAVYKVADDSGAPSVYWLTQDDNHQARRLYDNIATLTPFIKYQR